MDQPTRLAVHQVRGLVAMAGAWTRLEAQCCIQEQRQEQRQHPHLLFTSLSGHTVVKSMVALVFAHADEAGEAV